ncbi:MAG: uroporphyrinogen-III C-methyltransferase [Deltaproteobacteria bacterium]|nr:uroporphyrinogen-III C-methyltransferase [Deltaproteobacteria bacterium]
MTTAEPGMVYLVGAGPGDPGLLTLKARECIERADALVYDYLANPAFLEFAREGAELVYVGKKGGCHTRTQEEINRLIVELARSGSCVVRLKGGDPFVFGRGGEEAEELAAAGIPFEVVPGVTSAVAVPAYAGIPLTHRDMTATVAFVTGHEDPTKGRSSIAWEHLATGVGTLVFLMGVGNLPNIAERLMAHGRSGKTPVAVIRRGTVAEQQTVTGPLGEIAWIVKEKGLKAPAIIVVGEVVSLRETLNWFERRPLFGKRIVVTRAREQASGFLARLTRLGADCIQFPTIRVVPPESWEPLDRAIRDLEAYGWVLFTSVNGVRFFFERLEARGKDARALHGARVGAIGPATAEALRARGILPDLVPDEYRAEAVVEVLGKEALEGVRVLLPRAEKARELLPMELEQRGARVDVITAYRTVKPERDTTRVRYMLERGEIDLITFTSSSTVSNFLEMFPGGEDALRDLMKRTAVACIGPITAKTAEKLGFSVDVVPPLYTIDALTEAVVDFFSQPGAQKSAQPPPGRP